MKNFIVVLTLSLFVLACKEKTDKSNPEAIVKQKDKNELVIKMNFKSNKTDEIRLMLNNIVIDEFQKKNIHITEKVIPTTTAESLTANFGENFSENIIINLGNKEEKEFELESFNISYGKKELNITNPSEFKNYFVFNKFIDNEEGSKVIKTKRIDGRLSPVIILKKAVFSKFKI